MLVAYLMTTAKSYLEGAALRLFIACRNQLKVEDERKQIAQLLAKFRITVAELFVVDVSEGPSDARFAVNILMYTLQLSGPTGSPVNIKFVNGSSVEKERDKFETILRYITLHYKIFYQIFCQHDHIET